MGEEIERGSVCLRRYRQTETEIKEREEGKGSKKEREKKKGIGGQRVSLTVINLTVSGWQKG